MTRVGIINYGIGNYRSIFNAINLAGFEAFNVSNYKDLKHLDLVIMPGVGHYKTAISVLKNTELDKGILDLFGSQTKVIGICLGLHLLCNSSDEDKSEKGLGIFNCKIVKNSGNRVNTGWQKVWNVQKGETSRFFFNHGFHASISDCTLMISRFRATDFEFSAVVGQNNFYGVQFHIEKSGVNGINFLKEVM